MLHNITEEKWISCCDGLCNLHSMSSSYICWLHSYITSLFLLMRNINYTLSLKLHIRSEAIQNSCVNNTFIQVYFIATEESTHYFFMKKLLDKIHHDERTSTQYKSLTTERKYSQVESLQPRGNPVFVFVLRTAVKGLCVHMTM